MANNISQSHQQRNSKSPRNGFQFSFSLSVKRHWGTSLEKRLDQLPYTELREAFKTAATILEIAEIDESVTELVKMVKPRRVNASDLSTPYSLDLIFSRLFATDDEEPALCGFDVGLLGAQLALGVIARLWVLAHALAQAAKRPPCSQIVTAVTEVCILAERAKHIAYTEQRVDQWHKLNRSGRVLSSRSGQATTPSSYEDQCKNALPDLRRWLRKNGKRYSNLMDAATAYMECNFHLIPPAMIYGLMCQLVSAPKGV